VSGVARDRIVENLAAVGILPAGSEATVRSALYDDGAREHSPWYIQALLAAGAWLAAILFTVFFFGSLLSGVKNPMVHLTLGLSVCGGSAWIMRVKPEARFLVQFALALGIAGQLLFGYGFGDLADEFFAAALAVTVINIALIPLARQRLQTFLSVMIASGALLTALWDLKWWMGTNFLALLLALGVTAAWELKPWYVRRQWRPAGYGLAMSFFGVLHLSLLPASDIFRYRGQETSWWITTVGLWVLLALVMVRIAASLGHGWKSRPVLGLLAGVGVLAVTAHNSPGILGALLVLGLGYQRRDWLLSGLAVLFLAVFLSAYYYHLELTLLEKSAALAASGAVLLLFAFLLKKTAPTGESAHA